MSETVDQLNYIFNHVFLPLNLPGCDDSKDEYALPAIIIAALREFRQLVTGHARDVAEQALHAISQFKLIHSSAGINEKALITALTNLKGYLPLHVREQNAGILISTDGKTVTLEQFELSCSNEAVFTSQGRLTRTFPGTALSISTNVMKDLDFVGMIAQTLSTLSSQSAPGMQPQSKKSGVSHNEIRNTTNPAMISDFFMSLLKPIANVVTVSSVTKQTREEVRFSSSITPWRRSPMWLLLRVTLQFVCSRDCVPETLQLYKIFMVFLMQYVLKRYITAESDKLFIMNAKISKRMLKLGNSHNAYCHVIEAIIDTVDSSAEILEERWRIIRKARHKILDLTQLKALEFRQDAFINLPQLDAHIAQLQKRSSTVNALSFQPTVRLARFQDADLPVLRLSSSDSHHYVMAELFAFEDWIALHLPSWSQKHIGDQKAPAYLSKLLTDYYNSASTHYKQNPEAISIMLLTLFEIWLACDMIATNVSPLLHEYAAGISTDVLQNFLLMHNDHMDRLHRVEQYLSARTKSNELKPYALLYSIHDNDSFPARYFDESSIHQAVLAKIERNAIDAKNQKLLELQTLKSEYDRLDSLIQRSTHDIEKYQDYYTDEWSTRCKSNCAQCKNEALRKDLRISSHEWPLPLHDIAQKVVIFELQAPEWYVAWREATNFLLQIVLNGDNPGDSPRASFTLAEDVHLASYYTTAIISKKITLLSEVKPFKVTHWNGQQIATLSESSVCVPNGLRYRFFESYTKRFLAELRSNSTVYLRTTYVLPKESQVLQTFLNRPASNPDGPSPNHVIASQYQCPPHMSLQEYKELASLPLGHHIQWDNILVQLHSPGVDFKRSETAMFVLQCALQSGPPGADALRAAHGNIRCEDFAMKILEQLGVILARISENWESVDALSIFIVLALRVLNLTDSAGVRAQALTVLSRARIIAYKWTLALTEKAHAALTQERRSFFMKKSSETALACVLSYDVPSNDLTLLLLDQEDVSILVQCSVVLQDTHGAQDLTKGTLGAFAYDRHRRVLFRCYTRIVSYSDALNHAVSAIWMAFSPGGPWAKFSKSCPEWTCCSTAGRNHKVYFNALTGDLLVDGLPMNRAPQEYTKHAVYSTLFKSYTIEVMPASMHGMNFSLKREFNGYQVHLGLTRLIPAQPELVVRASSASSTFETLPANLFYNHYPVHFVDDYVHWLNVATGEVQFRLKSEAWDESSSSVWTLKQYSNKKWHLSRHGSSVVGQQTRTLKSISGILASLSRPSCIEIFTTRSGTESVEIKMPGIDLDFYLEKGSMDIQSKQYRGTIIDPDQSLHTLYGFVNKLILKSCATGARRVMLLESKTSFTRMSDMHLSVQATLDSVPTVHIFDIDVRLGRLSGDGSVRSQLFVAYLHALTSFCLPDPLIGRTGTEQALSILASAEVRSFQYLSQAELDILARIAALTPKRSFYPTHLRVMEVVEWQTDLSPLVQHDGFYTAVLSILQQFTDTIVFYADQTTSLKIAKPSRGDLSLLNRARGRHTFLRVDGFGAGLKPVSDQAYNSRDKIISSERGQSVALLASLVYHGSQVRRWPCDLDYLWPAMKRISQISRDDPSLSISKLKYDQKYLAGDTDFALRFWSGLHRLFLQRLDVKKYKFQFIAWLSTLAWAGSPNNNLVLQVLAMLFCEETLLSLVAPPAVSIVYPEKGKQLVESELQSIVKLSTRPMKSCPENDMVKLANESRKKFDARQRKSYESRVRSLQTQLIDWLKNQWPIERPQAPVATSPIRDANYIMVDQVMQNVQPLFKTWYNNKIFAQYLTQLETVVKSFPTTSLTMPPLATYKALVHPSQRGYVTAMDIFRGSPPALPPRDFVLAAQPVNMSGSTNNSPQLLDSLLRNLEKTNQRPLWQKSYLEDLRQSQTSLVTRFGTNAPVMTTTLESAELYKQQCQSHVNMIFDLVTNTITDKTAEHERKYLCALHSKQWPRVSRIFLLQQLARANFQQHSLMWKQCLIQLGVALTELQRAERLVQLLRNVSGRDYPQEVLEEIHNIGHQNWNPVDFPESLLIEVENNIMIREVQEEIAAQMRRPQCGSNVVMQLNMGEGKSSLIIPAVAAALADGSKLVRVVVAKPQSKQMRQMLVSKLGKLLNRRLFYMPISRALKLSLAQLKTLVDSLRLCMTTSGVLLVQPEHLLSFELMILESAVAGSILTGNPLLQMHRFLLESCRDLIDESDENFSAKFELIYSMGRQLPTELSPDRWNLIQQVLGLLARFVPAVSEEFLHSIEYSTVAQGEFPRIRILRTDAQQRLVLQIARYICDHGLDSFPIARQPQSIREAVMLFLTTVEISRKVANFVQESDFCTPVTLPILLLLRGLLAGGILGFTLGQKRWRVNYGLTNREPTTQRAVPYRAKDNPSARSEFSHPDVVMVLTCLSYYYEGLTDSNLFEALRHLVGGDQCVSEYAAWVINNTQLPEAFRTLNGVNLNDRDQCISNLFPALRRTKSVIDYYLSHIVFPKEMKEFPHKLSSSGWNLARQKTHVTTGFSGTKDSQILLPTTVRQLDLANQRHTSALVLHHILQQPNSTAVITKATTSSVSDAEHLLKFVTNLNPAVQVILDVGAQIIEMDNLQVATAWLSMTTDQKVEGVVFCNADDSLCVIDRGGRVELLQTSSFISRLGSCLVFLDEAHTRGIDLRLPTYYRAAVTLGANLSKDKLVQACMRMRKLGKGQSLVFCIPEEIQTKIKADVPNTDTTNITISDVLSWTVEETFIEISRNMPLWAAQGLRFFTHQKWWDEVNQSETTTLTTKAAEQFLEPEALSIEERYRPRFGENAGLLALRDNPDPNIQKIAERCLATRDIDFSSSNLHEEQERELSPEIEQEAQVQLPPAAEPALHQPHPHVVDLWVSAIIRKASRAYFRAFTSLRNTKAAADFDTVQLQSKLLVTADFAATVKKDRDIASEDSYIRHVQWLLSIHDAKTRTIVKLLILSPLEANSLRDRDDRHSLVTLHLFKAQTNNSYSVMDNLNFYTIPSRSPALLFPRPMAVQLNLFAGSLYINSYNDYILICQFLGIATQVVDSAMATAGWAVSADGFILRDGQGKCGGDSGLSQSPVKFLKVFLAQIRRNGESIEKTDMGGLLNAKIFREADFAAN